MQIAVEHHIASDVQLAPCATCARPTVWHCMSCLQPTCHPCSYSQFAMCQPCKAFYRGPIWELGKRADEFIRNEFLRVFRS